MTEGGAEIPDEERFLSNAILYAALHSPEEDETRYCKQCGAKLGKEYKIEAVQEAVALVERDGSDKNRIIWKSR